MICTIFGNFPDEQALRLEAISIARGTNINLDESALTSAACDIEQLLMGKTLAIKSNLKEKISRIFNGQRTSY